MPLARFEKLDPPRRQSILEAAAAEFADHGFEHASYNRIIQQAGLSKGAMYYYFADKDDLYRTVLDAALAGWFEQVGFPFEAEDRESYWRACQSMYARSLRFMLADPRNAALCLSITQAREALGGHPLIVELHTRLLAWAGELVQRGQRCGAVRRDLPRELLVQLSLAMMEAGDRWLAEQWGTFAEKDVEPTALMLVDVFRRLADPEVECP